MLHDRFSQKYLPAFTPRAPRNGDYVLFFESGKALLEQGEAGLHLPRYAFMADLLPGIDDRLTYLFSVDDAAFFLLRTDAVPEHAGLLLEPVGMFRTFAPEWQGFAGITGNHLSSWYAARKFCGVCGALTDHSPRERSVVCPVCKHVEYPKISPVVIVGVTDGDKLLVTKYNGRPYTKYALIGGFVEVGEGFEDAVRREVMEETGLLVTNIRYYKSQPWAFTETLLGGFFADVAGSRAITMDSEELSEARWMDREDIGSNAEFDINTISLTSEMISAFHNGTYPR